MSACPICRLDCGEHLFAHGPEQCRDELAREVARLTAERDAERTHRVKLGEMVEDLRACSDDCDLGALLNWFDPSDLRSIREAKWAKLTERDTTIARLRSELETRLCEGEGCLRCRATKAALRGGPAWQPRNDTKGGAVKCEYCNSDGTDHSAMACVLSLRAQLAAERAQALAERERAEKAERKARWLTAQIEKGVSMFAEKDREHEAAILAERERAEKVERERDETRETWTTPEQLAALRAEYRAECRRSEAAEKRIEDLSLANRMAADHLLAALSDRDVARAQLAAERAQALAERERAERAERRIAYNYDLLKAFDNYGSADLDVCVREVLRVVTADQPQAIDALQAQLASRDATIEKLEGIVARDAAWIKVRQTAEDEALATITRLRNALSSTLRKGSGHGHTLDCVCVGCRTLAETEKP